MKASAAPDGQNSRTGMEVLSAKSGNVKKPMPKKNKLQRPAETWTERHAHWHSLGNGGYQKPAFIHR